MEQSIRFTFIGANDTLREAWIKSLKPLIVWHGLDDDFNGKSLKEVLQDKNYSKGFRHALKEAVSKYELKEMLRATE